MLTERAEVDAVETASGNAFAHEVVDGAFEDVGAGDGTAGYAGDGGPASSAELNGPAGVAVDPAGDLVIADRGNNVVRFVPAASSTYYGVAMTAGDLYTIAGDGTAGYAGDGGPATAAELDAPAQAVFDAAGDVVVADTGTNRVRFVAVASGTYYGLAMTAGDLYTVAGDGTYGYTGNGGPATSAEVAGPLGVALDGDGGLLVPQQEHWHVRIVAATSGVLGGEEVTADDIYSLAGTGSGSKESGDGGPAAAAGVAGTTYVRTDAFGDVVVTDHYADAIRFVPAASGTYFGKAMSGGDIYTIAGQGYSYAGYSGDGGPATSALLHKPDGALEDASGDLVIADTDNERPRFVPQTSGTYFGQSMTAGDIYTIAGDGTAGDTGDGGPATAAELNHPGSVAVTSGGVLVADTADDVVRFVAETSGTCFGVAMVAGDIYTIAGDGSSYDTGDGGPATAAELSSPNAVSEGAAGLLIADSGNNRIRFLPAASGTYFGVAMVANDIYTIAGDGSSYDTGDGGPATAADLGSPVDTAMDTAGDLYVASWDLLRFVPQASGTYFGQAMVADDIYTIAGVGFEATFWNPAGIPATEAQLGDPISIAVDALGDVYITSARNGAVNEVVPERPASTTTATYDTDGEETSATSPGANAANYTTATTYDEDGEVTATTQAGGAGATVTPRTTSYTYDADGNLLTSTDARGKVTSYAYDAVRPGEVAVGLARVLPGFNRSMQHWLLHQIVEERREPLPVSSSCPGRWCGACAGRTCHRCRGRP